MKPLYRIMIIILTHGIYSTTIRGSYYHGPQGPRNESVDAARTRFDRMTVRQMQHVPVVDLTPNQQQALKELGTDYFMSEVIRPGCSSQARRRKYEVMYAKIGQLYRPT